MVSTDPISDMLTRIRNAIMVNKDQVALPYSRIKEAVARLLADNHYIQDVQVSGDGINKQLILQISDASSNAKITAIKRISTPGRRHYVNVKNIPVIKRGRGIVIVSTSQGVMTGHDAKDKRLGGELICQVY